MDEHKFRQLLINELKVVLNVIRDHAGEYVDLEDVISLFDNVEIGMWLRDHATEYGYKKVED